MQQQLLIASNQLEFPHISVKCISSRADCSLPICFYPGAVRVGATAARRLRIPGTRTGSRKPTRHFFWCTNRNIPVHMNRSVMYIGGGNATPKVAEAMTSTRLTPINKASSPQSANNTQPSGVTFVLSSRLRAAPAHKHLSSALFCPHSLYRMSIISP
jgi:hypothetical protein